VGWGSACLGDGDGHGPQLQGVGAVAGVEHVAEAQRVQAARRERGLARCRGQGIRKWTDDEGSVWAGENKGLGGLGHLTRCRARGRKHRRVVVSEGRR